MGHNLLFAARESFSRRELKKTLDTIFVLKKIRNFIKFVLYLLFINRNLTKPSKW